MSDQFGVTFIDLLKINRVLNVPRYQRAYRWSPERACALLRSLWELAQANAGKDDPRHYFLGSVILTPHGNVPGEEVYDVVDGQQRITTFSLIAAAARQKAYEIFGANADKRENFDFALPSHLFFDLHLRQEKLRIKSRRLRMAVPERDDLWARVITLITDITGERRFPHPRDVADIAGTYGTNYLSLSQELGRLVEPYTDQAGALTLFARTITNHLRVLVAIAPNLADARLAFRIAQIPGEPLDLAAVIRYRLAESLQTNDDERQSYEDAFADQTPGVDLDEDNKAVFAAARAFLRRVEIQGGRLDEDLDPEIVATQIGQSAPSGRIAARHMLIYLRAASEVRRTATLKAGPNTSNIIKALHNLFTLEECGRRVTQTGEDMASPVVTHLWRAVATKLFVAFGIRNVNGNIDDHTRDSVCNGLQGLESILLYCMLSRQGQQVLRNRLNAILEELEAPAITRLKEDGRDLAAAVPAKIQDFAPGLSLTADEQDKLWASLDEPLYGRGFLVTVALRYLLTRVNELHYLHHNPNARAIDRANNLRYNVDWNVEHIFPQNPPPGDQPKKKLREFFTADGKIHQLGNLTPLSPHQQHAAGNGTLEEKRAIYRLANSYITRDLADTAHFPDPLFGRRLFWYRQRYMKGLLGIYLFRFDGALREKARRRLDTPVPSQAGQTPPNGFPTNLSAPARGLGSVLLQTQSDGDATALDPTTGAADQEVGQAQNLQDLYEDLRDRISQRILELRPGGVPQMAPLEGNPPPQKNTNPALDQVIKRINGPVDRNSVRDHIAALYSLATTRRDDAVTKLYFLLAGDTYADATSAGLFVFRSRRLNIAHRVAMSIVTLADLREVLDAIRAA